jgi:hypothetical protein
MAIIEGIRSITQSWETVRYELLNTRICDLQLHMEGSPLETPTQKLMKELAAKRIAFKPQFYLTDSWGCPDKVPVIGIPFYLADRRLRRLEEEQTGEIEDEQTVMMFLRHEAGHSVNYAYGLWKLPEWVELFGPFTRPYREEFQPNPFSRRFVHHIDAQRYGRTYAQKHPDEDFAETFAVWLTPRSNWRTRYGRWPAIAKLKLVDRLVRTVCRKKPATRLRRALLTPVETMDMRLAEYYGKKADRLRQEAQGYVDDKLRDIFPLVRTGEPASAGDLFRRHRDEIMERVVRWAGLDEREAEALLAKLETRSDALELAYRGRDEEAKLLDAVAVAVSLAMDYNYSGGFAT